MYLKALERYQNSEKEPLGSWRTKIIKTKETQRGKLEFGTTLPIEAFVNSQGATER